MVNLHGSKKNGLPSHLLGHCCVRKDVPWGPTAHHLPESIPKMKVELAKTAAEKELMG
jgi:hypothetical protein